MLYFLALEWKWPGGVTLDSGWGLKWKHVLGLRLDDVPMGIHYTILSTFMYDWKHLSFFRQFCFLRYNLNATWLDSKLIFSLQLPHTAFSAPDSQQSSPPLCFSVCLLSIPSFPWGPPDVLHTAWLLFSNIYWITLEKRYQDTLKGFSQNPPAAHTPQPPLEKKPSEDRDSLLLSTM